MVRLWIGQKYPPPLVRRTIEYFALFLSFVKRTVHSRKRLQAVQRAMRSEKRVGKNWKLFPQSNVP